MKRKELNHEDAKKILFERNPAFKTTYENSKLEYEMFKSVAMLRMSQSLSQQEFADKIGTSQANISKLENGNLNPSVGFLRKIADSCGKKLEIKFV